MPSNTVRPFWAKPAFGLLLAAAFLAAMALFFTFYDFYRDVGDNLVAGGGLEEPPLAASSSTPGGPWRGRGPRVEWESQGGFDGSGGVRLGTQPGRGSSLNYGVEDPARFQLLRIAGRLRTDHIVPGTHGWNTARLLLSFTDGSGERVHHAVCEIEGSTPWRLCERVIAVPEGAVAAQIHVQNLAASGTLWVDDLALTPVVKKSSTPFWRALFGTLWAAVLVYCAWLSRLLDRPLGFAIIAIVLVIIAGVAAPVSTIEEIARRGADTVNGLTTADPFHAALPAAGSSDAPSRWTHEVRRAWRGRSTSSSRSRSSGTSSSSACSRFWRSRRPCAAVMTGERAQARRANSRRPAQRCCFLPQRRKSCSFSARPGRRP